MSWHTAPGGRTTARSSRRWRRSEKRAFCYKVAFWSGWHSVTGETEHGSIAFPVPRVTTEAVSYTPRQLRALRKRRRGWA